MQKTLIITDAWHPQTNGVVTTLQTVADYLPALGYQPTIIHPDLFNTYPLPGYPEIGLASNPKKIKQMLIQAQPDTIHIATEGPLGVYARHFYSRQKIPFTTSLHTKFPEYANERSGLPLSAGYRFLRWFHKPSRSVLCTTESHKRELEHWGLRNVTVWDRGVDTQIFKPAPVHRSNTRLRLLYVGRVAIEKNIEAFLELDFGKECVEKRIVGDGPYRAELQSRFPEAVWLGYKKGQDLVDEYANADVFVFPSKTDTFGLVMLEAMACGTPVAAFPVTGPVDVVRNGLNGHLSTSLLDAVQQARSVNRMDCRRFAQDRSWEAVARRMTEHFVSVRGKPSVYGLSETKQNRRRNLAA